MKFDPERFAAVRAAAQAELERKQSFEREMSAFPAREILRKRLERAPRLQPRAVLTLDQIAEREGTTVEELGESFRRDVAAYLERAEPSNPNLEDENLPVLDLMFQLSRLAQSPEALQRAPWLEDLTGFDRFDQAYLRPGQKPDDWGKYRKSASIRAHIEGYVRRYVHPQRTIELRPEGRMWDPKWTAVYGADGQWALMPNHLSDFSSEYRYVEASVVEEIAELVAGGYRHPDFSHASGSKALDGIEAHKAIVCSGELERRGEKIATGEVGALQWHVGAFRLWSVYADRGVRSIGSYNTVSWFDEYYVTFGINGERQREHMATLSDPWPEEAREIRDWGSEGILVGPEVPLTSLDVVYAWKRHEKEVRAWIEKNAPHARFVSLEAVEVLLDSATFVNALALEEGIEPEEAWRSLKPEAVTFV